MARWVLPKSHPFDSLSCPFLHLKDFCVDTEPAEQARITSHLKGSWLAALIPSITWILLFLSKYSWLIILYYFQMYHIAIQDFSRLYSIFVVLVLSRVWLFENLWTRALQAPLSMGFPRQEYWSGLPFLTPEGLPHPGIEPESFASPALTGGFFTIMPHGKPHVSLLSFQPLSHVQLFVTLWTAACQASLSFTIFQSLLKLMSFKSVMPFNHLILCGPLLLLPSTYPSIRDCSHQVAKVLKLQHQSFQWKFRVDFL